MAELSTCRYCGEPITWGQTSPGGKPIPLDPVTTERGNCERIGTTRAGAPVVRVLPAKELEATSLFATERFMPHHATCRSLPEAQKRPQEAPPALDGRSARDDALRRVEANAEPDVVAVARRIVVELPSGTLFTSDQVWFGLAERGLEPHERRVLGAVMRSLRKAGVIRATGEYRQSVRPECHAAPKPVYERV